MAKEATGAVDGKHYDFKCQDCGAPLADLWVMHPDQTQWAFQAECDHCGGRSEPQTVLGRFVIGQGKGEIYSNVVDYDYSTDPILIKTKKVKDYVV